MGENNLKRVLVTGSSRGIGKETALYLAKNGFDIDVHYAGNEAKAKETADEIKALGRNAEILKFDIKNREECASVLEGKLYYGIVLNAGIAISFYFVFVKLSAVIFPMIYAALVNSGFSLEKALASVCLSGLIGGIFILCARETGPKAAEKAGNK